LAVHDENGTARTGPTGKRVGAGVVKKKGGGLALPLKKKDEGG